MRKTSVFWVRLPLDSVHEGRLSRVEIDSNGMCHKYTLDHNQCIVGVPVTEHQRVALSIPKNGLRVVLDVSLNHHLCTFDDAHTFFSNVQQLAPLRDIFSRDDCWVECSLKKGAPTLDLLTGMYILPTTLISSRRLQYCYPIGSDVLDVTFTLPRYPEYQARFVVKKVNKPLPQPLQENMMEFGFMIKDNSTIYEVTTLGENGMYRWNPNINYLYG